MSAIEKIEERFEAVRQASFDGQGASIAVWEAEFRAALAEAFESGARHYAAVDPCCGTYHLHEIENPHTGEPIPTREGEDDL